MHLFLDTSALAKRYVEEPGSEEVALLCMKAGELAISVLCVPEMISTLRRLLRERRLTPKEYDGLRESFLLDVADAELHEVTPETVAAAVRVLEAHTLRTLDALHLATALIAAPDAFVSADRAQLAAARRCGLKTIEV
jgi:predicted nucleic acid-binding protein